MTFDPVKQQLDALRAKGRAQGEDVAVLRQKAEKSERGRKDAVSNAAAREIADFFIAAVKGQPPPKMKEPVALDSDAIRGFNGIFVAHNMPYGANKGPMKERILAALAARGDEPWPVLETKPRTGSLQPLRLSNDPQVDAYVDIVKKQFVVKKDGVFYGAFELTT
jgi:hypothetical protein